jgi:hypothetical protein
MNKISLYSVSSFFKNDWNFDKEDESLKFSGSLILEKEDKKAEVFIVISFKENDFKILDYDIQYKRGDYPNWLNSKIKNNQLIDFLKYSSVFEKEILKKEYKKNKIKSIFIN